MEAVKGELVEQSRVSRLTKEQLQAEPVQYLPAVQVKVDGVVAPDIALDGQIAQDESHAIGQTRAQELVEIEGWLAEGRAILNAGNKLPWAAGDWYVRGAKYGRAAEMAESIGWNVQALKDAAVVARAFPPEDRIHKDTFSHYRVVAALPKAKAKKLLERAEHENLTVAELSAIVNPPKVLELTSEDIEQQRVDRVDALAADIPSWTDRSPVLDQALNDLADVIGRATS